MASQYLEICNYLLRELNEAELTQATFNNAVGIHAYVKDIVNRAYLDIVNTGDEWPFLAFGAPDEPFEGNDYIETVVGQRWYVIKEGSTETNTDFNRVDWDSFYLTDFGVAGVTTDYESQNLNYISQANWILHFREQENDDSFQDTPIYGKPLRVMQSADRRSFGLSPIPDSVYRIYFTAWNRPTELAAYNDEIVFPDQYKTVLIDRARWYLWQFKKDAEQVMIADRSYMMGLKVMRLDLLEQANEDITDDRIRF